MMKDMNRDSSADFTANSGSMRDLTADELKSVCGGQQYPSGYPDGLPMPVPRG